MLKKIKMGNLLEIFDEKFIIKNDYCGKNKNPIKVVVKL